MPVALLVIEDEYSVVPIRHDGDVAVKGLICEGRNVQVGGSLTVGGDIDAVMLNVGRSVTATGGITGKQKGRYTIGGDLRCRFITGATITGRGNVRVDDEMLHSRLTCVGELNVALGVVYGGDVSANGGVTCRVLGHRSGMPTLVEAGEGRAMRVLTEVVARQIQENRQRIADSRATSGPMMEQLKRLSAQDREKATELLYEANELETATNTMAIAFEQRKRLINDRARPDIVVSEIVHPGVVVRFGAVEALISTPLVGPLTVTCRKSGETTEIVAIDASDGTARVLHSRPSEAAVAA